MRLLKFKGYTAKLNLNMKITIKIIINNNNKNNEVIIKLN
jgi:hypothetical protein